MPNKRDPRKKMMGIWLSPEERRDLDSLARWANTNRSALLRKLVENALYPTGRGDVKPK